MIATSFESAESVPTLSAKTFEEPIVKRLFSNEIFKYLLKMEFNIVAIHPAVQDALLGVAGADTSFFSEKVVDYRNFELSKKVNESSEKKIIITYGALHFPGFLAEIRKTGGSWSVKEISSEKVFP